MQFEHPVAIFIQVARSYKIQYSKINYFLQEMKMSLFVEKGQMAKYITEISNVKVGILQIFVKIVFS